MKKHIFKFANIKPTVFLYCLLILSSSMIAYSAVKINSITFRQSLNYKNHIRYLIANYNFKQGTDRLTESARHYVLTMKPEFMEHYFREVSKERHRDQALAAIKDLNIAPSLKDILYDTMYISKNLMNSEYHAMHLIALNSGIKITHKEIKDYSLTPEEQQMSARQRRELAEELLWGDEYIKKKSDIYSNLMCGLNTANSMAMERHLRLRNKLLRMLSLSAISLTALVLAICGFIFLRRRRHIRLLEVQVKKNARMNVRLKEERDKVLQAEKAKSYFFSTVSHDIRTPLNSIIGFSEMLRLGIDDPSEKDKALDAIIMSGKTLLELINDVLDLSKLEAGKMELHPMPTNIAKLIAQVVNSFKMAASRTSVLLRTEVGEMPMLKLDPQRMRQILFNLIGNAVKFTDRGSITVRAAYANGSLALSVTDTGCGISKDNIDKLMSPYVQLHGRDSTNGTGLGLAICKQLATQMKGTLELESAVGVGSTFTLRVPNVETFTAQESEAYFNEHKASGAELHLDESIREKRILLVDDQKLNRLVLQTMLSRLGIHKVLMAENGMAALEVLEKSEHVDIVLTDMFMPVMDGAELVRAIREHPRFAAIPVYVITADVEMQSEYGQMGFDDMLIKPITLDKLKELLVKYTASRRQPEAATDNGGDQA